MITFKTKFFQYNISPEGENIGFYFQGDLANKIIKTPCAFITNKDHKVINSKAASFKENILTVTFADDTVAEFETECKSEYITFTVKSISRTDFISVSYVNIHLNCNEDKFCGCLIGMTLATHMKEHPGFNKELVASAYPHIGLFKTNRSNLPSKAAIIGAPKDKLLEIQKKVLSDVPKGELPISKMGGPYAQNALPDAADTYTIFFETVTDKNIDDVIDSLKKFSINQIILHHYGHYTQGDFKFEKSKFPGTMSDFKKIIDKFHSEGIKVGLQTYSFFLVWNSSYVTPVPHKDLDILKTFTLKENISADDKYIFVKESTDGVTPDEGFIFVNSPYLWIDDELVKFTKADNGRFEISERGALGTTPANHFANTDIKQLKEYFLIPLAKAGSELFYEIARNTAKFYNECGADFFYLDALDGAFVLDGEDYVWYHAVDFINEMFKYIEGDIIFDCCYNPSYTGSWFVRSRYGAIDVSLNGHRRFADAHMKYNADTAEKMCITPEMGWIDLFPDYETGEYKWQNEPLSAEDLEYFCAKAYSAGASLAFLESFHKYKNTPRGDMYAEILKKYADLRKSTKPSESVKSFIKKEENGATLKNGKLIKTKHEIVTFEHGNDKETIFNPFEKQNAKFKFEPLCSAEDYEHKDAVTLLEIDSTKPTENQKIRFETPVNSNGNTGLGVWCYGDNSGARLCIAMRNFAQNGQRSSQHFIKVNFSGWKYFAFHEHENETLPLHLWPRKELIYGTYNKLQEFYHHYRVNLNYSAIDGVDIETCGNCKIYLRDLKLLPTKEYEWKNPEFTAGSSKLKVFATLSYGDILSFNGNECVVCDSLGNIKSKPEFSGDLVLNKGENKISISGAEDMARCRFTATIEDGII